MKSTPFSSGKPIRIGLVMALILGAGLSCGDKTSAHPPGHHLGGIQARQPGAFAGRTGDRLHRPVPRRGKYLAEDRRKERRQGLDP